MLSNVQKRNGVILHETRGSFWFQIRRRRKRNMIVVFGAHAPWDQLGMSCTFMWRLVFVSNATEVSFRHRWNPAFVSCHLLVFRWRMSPRMTAVGVAMAQWRGSWASNQRFSISPEGLCPTCKPNRFQVWKVWRTKYGGSRLKPGWSCVVGNVDFDNQGGRQKYNTNALTTFSLVLELFVAVVAISKREKIETGWRNLQLFMLGLETSPLFMPVWNQVWLFLLKPTPHKNVAQNKFLIPLSPAPQNPL